MDSVAVGRRTLLAGTAGMGLLGLPSSAPRARAATAAGGPAVVPSVASFTPAAREDFTPRAGARIVVAGDQPRVLQDARLVAKEWAAVTGLAEPQVVVDAAAQPGDVRLHVGTVTASDPSAEAYAISSGPTLTITGRTPAAVFHGTRTLLQSLRAERRFPAGEVVDHPARGERALMLDCGRKYYSVAWIKRQIRMLAWRRMNTLQLHFSENEGFRIQSERYPQIVSAQHLTKDEVRDLVAYADRYHVTVIPDTDMPGHLRQVLNAYPHLRLVDRYGAVNDRDMDFSKPEARELIKGIVTEMSELFPGPVWHIGFDEFTSPEDADRLYPQLTSYAWAQYGQNAVAADGFAHFLNEMAEFVGGLGYRARAWNDLLYRVATLGTPSPDIDITYWTRWNSLMRPVSRFVDAGHRLVNFNDAYFYYVLGENAGYTYPRPEKIYDEWQPGRFPASADGPQTWTAPYPDWLVGASFAIWSDKPEAQTEDQVAAGIRLPLWAMAQRCWTPAVSDTYATHAAAVEAVGDAPAVAA